MKTKALSLTLAGIISLQSAAMAQTDRTAGVGEIAATEARTTLETVRNELLVLDESLAQAAQDIQKKDTKRTITNGIAIAGAAVGVGLVVTAGLSLRKRSEFSPLAALLHGLLSVGATIGSSAFGVTSEIIKNDVDTKTLEAQLTAAEAQLNTLAQGSGDANSVEALKNLTKTVQATRESLTQYQDKRSNTTRNRLASQAAQLMGVAMTTYGLVQRDSNLVLIGPMLMMVGNISTVLTGVFPIQKENVLAEIAKTREALKASVEVLK